MSQETKNSAIIAAISDRLAHPDDHQPAAYFGLSLSDGQALDKSLDAMTTDQQKQALIDALA